MTLNRRALQVILPSILLCFIVAFATVYQVQRSSLLAQERVRTQLTTTQLQSSYARYVAFAESYLNNVVQSEVFRHFLREENDSYRDIALGGSLERTLRSYQQYESNFLSLAVLDVTGHPVYYFENSADPFASLSGQQRAVAVKLAESQSVLAWALLDGDSTRLVYAQMLDPHTLMPPIPARRDQAVVVQLALDATRFDQLRADATERYEVTITPLRDIPPTAEADDKSSVTLSTGHRLRVTPRAERIEALLAPVRLWFIVITAIFTGATAGLLVWLVRRYLTQPVRELEHAVNAVASGDTEELILPAAQVTEVDHLGQTFRQLYAELATAFRQTQLLADTDQLTGLHNLTYMTKAAAEIVRRAKENTYKVAFLYIDLDNFKFVNDRFGHDVGDSLLKSFSRRALHLTEILQPAFPRTNHRVLVSRIAGDEFGIIIEDADPHEPDLFCAELLEMFRRGFNNEAGQFPVTASIGIALFPDHGHALSQLVSNADTAMYQAKALGKNRYAYYSQELAQQMRRKRDIEIELKSLACDDEFFLVYMPLVATRNGAITGVEALLRWVSPKLGMVSPAEFIPIAETCGLFTKIDQWVIKAGLRDYARLEARLGQGTKLSLNLSSAQLQHRETAEMIIHEANTLGISPANIQLEMTETFGADYTRDTDNLLQTLRKHNFKIAIDDFGTGYTSLSQMVEYPVDMIKLDRAFIEKARQSERTNILRPLIELCHAQGMSVTAEGVETEEHVRFLTSVRCDYLQGFHFGKPCRLEELPLTVVVPHAG